MSSEIIYQPCEDANTLEGLKNCGCDPLMDGITYDDLSGKVVKSKNQTICYNDNPDDHALRQHLLNNHFDPYTKERATVLGILGQTPNELMEKHTQLINKIESYKEDDYDDEYDYYERLYENVWSAKETVEYLMLLLNSNNKNNKELLRELMFKYEIDVTRTLLEHVVGKDWKDRKDRMSTFKRIQNFLREWWKKDLKPDATFDVEYILSNDGFEDFKVFFTKDTLFDK